MTDYTFAKTPAALLQDSKISDSAVRLFGHIHWRSGDTGWFTESPRKTAEILNKSVKTIRRLLDELEEAEWVAIIHRRHGNSWNKSKVKPFKSPDHCRAFKAAFIPSKTEALRGNGFTCYPEPDCEDCNDDEGEGMVKIVPMDKNDHRTKMAIGMVTNDYTPMDMGDHTQPDSLKPDSLKPDLGVLSPSAIVSVDSIADQYNPDSQDFGADFVYIGRYHRSKRFTLKASDWKNPYKVGKDGTRDEVISKFRDYILSKPELIVRLPELQNKTLVCWCNPEPCHGDVLLELLADNSLIAEAQNTLTAQGLSESHRVGYETDMYDAIAYAWQNTDGGYIALMRLFLTGKAKKGKWGEFVIEQPMTPIEVLAFGKARSINNLEMPTVPETIQRLVYQFRGSPLYDRYMEKATALAPKVFTRLINQAQASNTPEGSMASEPEVTEVKPEETNPRAAAILDAALSQLSNINELIRN